MIVQVLPFPAASSAWSMDVTAASADVPSTLTDFPMLVHFETLGDDFWDNVSATGGDIRAEVGGSQVPFHLTYIDVAEKKGWGFALVPSLSSSSDTTITLYGDGSSALPAASSTYGSQAVWADYEAVYPLNGSLSDATGNGYDLAKRTGTADAVFDLVEWGAGGGLVVNGDTSLIASGFAPHPVATLGAMGNSHKIDPPSNGGLIAFYDTYGDDTDRVSLIQRLANPNVYSTYDFTNNYLDGSADVDTFEPHRLHLVMDGTTGRYVYLDGTAIATDLSTSVEQWDGGTLIVADSGATSEWYGEIGWAYVRLEAMSADWLAVEAAMMEPGFLTVSDLPTVAPYTEVYTPTTNPASTLVDFPYWIPLSELSHDFWHNVKADGSDIRVYDGSDTAIPFQLVSIDKDARDGFLIAKQTVTTSGATYKIEVGYPARSALAATDSYGSEAVWADYKGVWLFDGDQLDETSGSNDLTVKTGSAAYGKLLGLPALDTRTASFQSSVDNMAAGSAVYTISCLASLDRNDGNNQQAMTFCQTYGSTSNRSTIGNRDAGEVYTTYSAANSWMDGPVVDTGVPVRLAATYNGSSGRQLFVDGALENSGGCSSVTMDTLVIGGGSSTAAHWRGRIAFAYLRYEIMSDDWLAYEADMILRTPNGVESLWVGGEA